MVRSDWNVSLGLLMCKNTMFSIIFKCKIGEESGSLCFTRGLTIGVLKLLLEELIMFRMSSNQEFKTVLSKLVCNGSKKTLKEFISYVTWASLLRLMSEKMDILLFIAVDGELETTPNREVPAMVCLMVADFISEEYCKLHFSVGKRLDDI